MEDKEIYSGQLIELTISQKNSKILILNGFSYTSDARRNKWRCTKRQNRVLKCSCNLRAEEIDGKFYLQKLWNSHNHSPDPETLPVLNVINSIKDIASTSSNLPCQILQSKIAKLPENVGGCLPSKAALTQIIKREQRKLIVDKEPVSLAFDIPERFLQIDGEQFVYGDIKEGDNRIIIFTIKNNLTKLRDAEFWMMDGTFKVVPKLFYQLYTVHCSIAPHKTVHPMVYALMSGKSSAIYNKLFTTLQESAIRVGISLAPKLVITDFEKAAISNIRSVFERVNVKGCNFHFMQNIYRHIQKIGWQVRYGTDIEFAMKVRQVAALCFLEPEEIPEWFKDIKEELGAEFEPLTNWMDENYVSGKNNRTPLFPPSLWSISEQNKNKIPRTQNYAESFHNYFNVVIGRPHISVYHLIDELKKQTKITSAEIEKLTRGNLPPKKNKKFILKEKRIELILSKKKEFSKFGFLKAIAGNISF